MSQTPDHRRPPLRLADVPPTPMRGALASAALVAPVALLRPEALWPALLGLGLALAVLLLPPRRRARGGEGARRTRGEAGARPEPALRAALDALREPAFLIDGEAILRHGNPASLPAFGAVPLGEPLSLRFRSPDFLAAVEAAVAGGEPGEASYEDRRPFDRVWQAEITPLRGEAGAGAGLFLLLFHDRSVERRLERMRSDFVANASHELRTPLASLVGFIETLQGPAREDAQARERFLAIMRDQAARMSRLIDDLLSLSRIEMKRHVAPSAEVDLRDIFEDVAAGMAFVAEENGVEIRYERPAWPFLVSGDEDELTQVFSNLVENACKYAAGGGRIDLELSRGREGGRPVLDAAVRDYGAGIAPEHVPRLTERFYRVDVGTSRAKRGTGLGLSIVRNLLLHHRARLVITSRIGEGSVFLARFPERGEADPMQITK